MARGASTPGKSKLNECECVTHFTPPAMSRNRQCCNLKWCALISERTTLLSGASEAGINSPRIRIGSSPKKGIN